MSQPYIGQIAQFGFNFPPRGWALCNGQILSIQQNAALFSLLGTTYGGNGVNTFALPDLRGRVLVHQGQGTGLANRQMGETGGQEAHTLTSAEMPQHNHLLAASNAGGALDTPNGNVLSASSTGSTAMYRPASDGSNLAATAVSLSGGNQPHNNMQPFQVVSFCIALQGIFPSRN